MTDTRPVTWGDLEMVLHFGVEREDIERYTDWPNLAPRLAQQCPNLSAAVSRMESLREDLRYMEAVVREEIEMAQLFTEED